MDLQPPVSFSLFQQPLQADLFPPVFVFARVILWGPNLTQVQLPLPLQCPVAPGNAKGCVVSAGTCRVLLILHQCIRYGGTTGQGRLLCRKLEVFLF